MSMRMEYKGYVSGPIHFDSDTEIYTGIVAGLRDVIHFRGKNEDELLASFREGIEDYLSFCSERGQAPEINAR